MTLAGRPTVTRSELGMAMTMAEEAGEESLGNVGQRGTEGPRSTHAKKLQSLQRGRLWSEASRVPVSPAAWDDSDQGQHTTVWKCRYSIHDRDSGSKSWKGPQGSLGLSLHRQQAAAVEEGTHALALGVSSRAKS